MMQEARTSLHKGLIPAQVFQSGFFSSSLKARDWKTHPTLQPSTQGPWGSTTVTSMPPPPVHPEAQNLLSLQPPQCWTQAITSLAGWGPDESTRLLCAPVTVYSCGSRTYLTSYSASLTPQQTHSFPAWNGAPRQSQSLAHSQHPEVLTRGLSEQRLLSGPTHVGWSWRGGLCVPFSSFHAYEDVASLLIRPLQRTVTKTLSL